MLRLGLKFLTGMKSPAVPSLTSASSIRMSSTSTPARLQGKVAIVTASTDGIGFAVAKRLAQDGASVFISSRKQANVDQALDQLKSDGLTDVFGTVCHVAKAEDRKKLFDLVRKEKGKLDILVSNAAVNPAFGPMLEVTEEQWDKIFEVNVKSAFLLCKESMPLLSKSKTASITFISSIGGYQVLAALGAYSVSKTALLGLTKGLAEELAPAIRVNCVCPGIIDTKFSSALTSNEGIAEQALLRVPLKRFGQPQEMAGLVSFLASEDASYITGESIVAAGGYYSRL
jgi:dehydrogenase/reductase SDR family protein 4